MPPKYKTLYDKRGREYRVKVRDGFHRKVWVEPIYETRVVKTWVPARLCPLAGAGFASAVISESRGCFCGAFSPGSN